MAVLDDQISFEFDESNANSNEQIDPIESQNGERETRDRETQTPAKTHRTERDRETEKKLHLTEYQDGNWKSMAMSFWKAISRLQDYHSAQQDSNAGGYYINFSEFHDGNGNGYFLKMKSREQQHRPQ